MRPLPGHPGSSRSMCSNPPLLDVPFGEPASWLLRRPGDVLRYRAASGPSRAGWSGYPSAPGRGPSGLGWQTALWPAATRDEDSRGAGRRHLPGAERVSVRRLRPGVGLSLHRVATTVTPTIYFRADVPARSHDTISGPSVRLRSTLSRRAGDGADERAGSDVRSVVAAACASRWPATVPRLGNDQL